MKLRNLSLNILCCQLAFISIALYGCSKHGDQKIKTKTDTDLAALKGSVYVEVDDSIKMWNAKTGANVWGANDVQAYGSYSDPMIYDAGIVYSGGSAGIQGYNAQTGAAVWQASFYDPSLNGGSNYRIPAFVNDSLAVITSPTGVYVGGAQLYCYNKFTGKRLWQTQIDSNINGFDEFNPIPLNVNNKVVVLGKEWSSNFKICCYDPLTGKQTWQSDWNPYLSTLLKANAGNVYGLQAATVWGYNGGNGAMLWQTTLDVKPGSEYAASFFDDKYVYINRINPDKSYTIFVLNKLNGAVISTTSIPLGKSAQEHFALHYQNGILYLGDYNNSTSDYDGTLYAYTFPGMQLKWSYNFTWISSPPTAPLITDQYIIFPASHEKQLDRTKPYSDIVFLDLNGKLVNEIGYAGTSTSRFLYIDDTGKAYMTDAY